MIDHFRSACSLAVVAGLFTATHLSAQLNRAFVWNNIVTGTGTPPPGFQYNSTGNLNSVTNLSTGKYRVDLPGLGGSGGTVQVTAYNGNQTCQTDHWSPTGTLMQVWVNCFTPAGMAVNGMFTMLFYSQGTALDDTDNAYLWADRPTASSYTPNLLYQWNSSNSPNTITRTSTGLYVAHLPRRQYVTSGGTVMVTAYGSGPERCKVTMWSLNAADRSVNIACFNAAGAPVDTQYTLSFLTDLFHYDLHTAGIEYFEGAFAWADLDSTPAYTPPPSYQTDINGGQGSQITVARASTGVYQVTLPGQPNYNATTALAPAYGGSTDYCNVGTWGASGSGTLLYVRCFDRFGSPADSEYTVQYTTNQLLPIR